MNNNTKESQLTASLKLCCFENQTIVIWRSAIDSFWGAVYWCEINDNNKRVVIEIFQGLGWLYSTLVNWLRSETGVLFSFVLFCLQFLRIKEEGLKQSRFTRHWLQSSLSSFKCTPSHKRANLLYQRSYPRQNFLFVSCFPNNTLVNDHLVYMLFKMLKN